MNTNNCDTVDMDVEVHGELCALRYGLYTYVYLILQITFYERVACDITLWVLTLTLSVTLTQGAMATLVVTLTVDMVRVHLSVMFILTGCNM